MNTLKKKIDSVSLIEYLFLFAVACLFLFIPKVIIEPWRVVKIFFFLVPFISAFIIAICSSKQILQIKFEKFDLFCWAFITWHFLSFFWAYNPSLIWDKSMNWLSIYLLYKVVSSIKIQYNAALWGRLFILVNILNYIFLLIFIIGPAFQSEGIGIRYEDIATQRSFSGNNNFHSAILAIMFPFYFLVIEQFKKYKWTVFLLIFIHLFFLLIMNARGSTLALVVSSIVLLPLYLKKISVKNILSIGGSIILLIGLIFFFVKDDQEFIEQYNLLRGVSISNSAKTTDDRIEMWEKTIQMSKEHLLLGTGSGNWKITYQKYGVHNLRLSFDRSSFYTHPHNQFMQILGELGIGALLIYIALILYAFYFFKNVRFFGLENRKLSRVFISILITYCIVNSFYGEVLYSPALSFTFIGLLLGFCKSQQQIEADSFKNKKYIFILLGLFLVYFIYLSSYTYYRIKNKELTVLIKQNKREEAIQLIDQIYHPHFKTYFKTQELLAQKGDLLWKTGTVKASIKAFEKALEHQPYSHSLWYQLGNRLYLQNRTKRAKACLMKSYKYNKNFFNTHVLLAKIHIEDNNLPEARRWLNFDKDIGQKVLDKCSDNEYKNRNIKNKNVCKKFSDYRKEVKKLKKQINQKIIR